MTSQTHPRDGAGEAGRIDRSSPMPLYHQLERILRKDISRGRYAPGDLLPSEHELCERYEVSRSVIRQTLANLAHAGVVHSERGKGTFVAEPKLQERFVQRAAGFYQDLTRMGRTVTTTVVRQEVVELPLHVRDFLEVSHGVQIDRVRSVDGRVVVFVTTYLPSDRFPGLEHEDLNDRSLYAFLYDRYGQKVASGRRTVEAVAAEPEVAVHLEVAPGTPLLLLRSASRDIHGHPLEWFEAWHRADRTLFELEIVPGEPSTPFRQVVRSPRRREPILSGTVDARSTLRAAPAAVPERSARLVDALRSQRVIAVLAGGRIGDPAGLVQAVGDGGIAVAAVDMRAAHRLDALAEAAANGRGGAWGVRDDAEVARVVEAGARFVVLLPHAVVTEPARHPVPVLRSALTPTEVGAAWRDTQAPVVIYPAGVHGPDYLAGLQACEPEALLIPAGEIHHEQLAAFLRAGACAVALSGELCPPEIVEAGNATALLDRARVLHDVLEEALE
jgi:GntR family transcriptional regulator